MGKNENSKLLDRDHPHQQVYSIPIGGDNNNSKPNRKSMMKLMGNSEYARSARSIAGGRLGGSRSMGSFRNLHDEMQKPMTPSEMGQQQLYTQVPFQAVFGLQKKEREVANSFAVYAADLDVSSTSGLTEQEKDIRRVSSSMLILDEMEDAKVVTAPLIFAVIVAVTSMFLVGYNGGVLNAPEKIVFPGHSTLMWSLATAMLPVGALFGSALGGKLADKRGRRGAMMIGIWAFIFGGALQTVAPNMVIIIVARAVIGFACGISTAVIPIYLGEMAPPSLRGTLGTLTQFAQNIGIFLSVVFAFPLKNSWRALFSVTPVLSFAQVLLSGFLLESPRWLLSSNPKSLRARFIIKRLRGLRNEEEVEQEVSNFLAGSSAQDEEEGGENNMLKELWYDPKRSKLLITALVLPMAQQFSGINAIIYYSGTFFDGVIDDPLVGSTIVFGVNIVASYVSLLLMDSTGRKTLILWSSAGMSFACILVTVSLMGLVNNIYAILAVSIYLIFFQIGLGPIPWLIVAEMFEGKYVTMVMSLSSQLNWICNFIVGMVFPIMDAHLAPYTFVPFLIVLVCTFVFTIFIVPETQGTTPEELVAEMVKTNSQSMVYEVNEEEAGAINLEWEKAMQQLLEEENAENKNK